MDYVHGALRIWLVVIKRDWNLATLHSDQRSGQFHRAATCAEVAEKTFRSGDGRISQDVVDGLSFVAIVVNRAQAVGIHVADVGRL